MSSPPPIVPRGLYWVRPRGESGNELRDVEGRMVGTLRFLPKPAITWGYTDRWRARGEVGSSHWDLSIERKGPSGFFGLSGTALIDDGKTGTLKAGAFLARGALSLASGRRLQWKGSVFEGRPEAANLSEWPLLVVLALYLRLLMNRTFL